MTAMQEINAMHQILCNQCYAIIDMQSMLCNQCIAINDMQSILCKQCFAINAKWSMKYNLMQWNEYNACYEINVMLACKFSYQ